MGAHLDVVEQRVRRLYVRPRALFAGAVVAALIDGTVVEFPAAAKPGLGHHLDRR